MPKGRTMKQALVLFISIIFIGCASSSQTGSSLSNYIILEREESGYRLNEDLVPEGNIESLISLLAEHPGKKILLGKETEFTVGDILTIGAGVEDLGYEMFFLNSAGEIKSANFISAN